MIAFEVPETPGELDELRWLFDEWRHSCDSSYMGACRACAQARIQHDGGDENPGEWPGAKGLWLVGGGRMSNGASAGCAMPGLLPDGRPVGSDRWDAA